MSDEKIIKKQDKYFISYSQIAKYHNCEYDWYQHYILKNKKYSGNVHSIFGITIHILIQEYLTKMFSVNLIELSNIDWDKRYLQIIKEVYSEEMSKNGGNNILDAKDLMEMYNDGRAIFDYFLSHRNTYFRKSGWELVGIELPLKLEIMENVIFVGKLDVVLREKKTGKILIVDLKSSLYGWKDKQKKEEIKRFQLQIYKKYYSELTGVPLGSIDVRFLILKRNLGKNDIYGHRLQKIDVPSSSYSINKNYKELMVPFLNIFKKCEKDNKKLVLENKEFVHAHYATACKYCPFYYKVANKYKDKDMMVCPKWNKKYNFPKENKALENIEYEENNKIEGNEEELKILEG